MGLATVSPATRTGGRAFGARRNFALLSPQFLDELRQRVSLSQLVGRSVPLKKAGNEFKACCPFHSEKTPSFWVNDQKGFYHCFGCQAHGDAIRWLTEAKGLSFMDAVKQLADEVGMELPKPAPEDAARRERLEGQQDILAAATQYFRSQLSAASGANARDYLTRRGVGAGTISDFSIGFAPDGRNNLGSALAQFSTDQLVAAGLLISVEDKKPYDRFRNRVMVPIRDPRGRVIAFGGRILGDGEPKYLNSPDTELFDKSRVLFNLDRAAPASRQSGRIIVVEGYFDAIMLDQSGIREAVAPMGTALTDLQLEQLWRLTDEPILCFDGDNAGLKAAERAAHRAMPSLRPGNQLRIALLPAGLDPDDLIRQRGVAAFEQAVGSALPLATFLYRSELAKIDSDRPEKRAGLRRHLDDLARSCPDRMVADEFARTFKNLFFEDFGWRPKQRRDVKLASIRTSVRVAPDVARDYARSALFGLTRFPAVAKANLQALEGMPIKNPELRRWRDAIGEAIYLQPDLEDDGLQAVVEAELLPETLRWDLTHDLRFHFTRKAADRVSGMRQVEALVRFLYEEQEIADQMDYQNGRITPDMTGDRYAEIELARQTLREARAKLIREGSYWNGYPD